MKRSVTLVYFDTTHGKLARYVARTRTHQFDIEPGTILSSYWIEMLRTAPETWDDPDLPPEVA
jgi:hypothetical protein